MCDMVTVDGSWRNGRDVLLFCCIFYIHFIYFVSLLLLFICKTNVFTNYVIFCSDQYIVIISPKEEIKQLRSPDFD